MTPEEIKARREARGNSDPLNRLRASNAAKIAAGVVEPIIEQRAASKQTTEQYIELAREMGAEHGKAAASWYFDGNTSDETYRAVLQGIEDGDPEILDTFPSSPLSGEWADSPSPSSVLDDLGIEYEDAYEGYDGILLAYEDGFYQASSDEIERVARLQTDGPEH